MSRSFIIAISVVCGVIALLCGVIALTNEKKTDENNEKSLTNESIILGYVSIGLLCIAIAITIYLYMNRDKKLSGDVLEYESFNGFMPGNIYDNDDNDDSIYVYDKVNEIFEAMEIPGFNINDPESYKTFYNK